MKTKTKYLTKKRRAIIFRNKFIAIVSAIAISSSIIGYSSQIEAYEMPKDEPIKHIIKNDIKLIKLITNNPEIETQIREIANKECYKKGLGDYCINDLVGIAYAEHRDLDCERDGDNGKSWGCFQINSDYHNITREQALDLNFSINWTLNRMIHYGYPEYRSYAIMKHNGTPNTKRTLSYLATVNEIALK
jgi:hypothetical protein